MRVRSVCTMLIYALPLLSVCPAFAAAVTADGLTLELDAGVNVTRLAVGGTELNVVPEPLVTLCDVEQGQFIAPAVTGGSLDQGLVLDFAEANATARLTVKADDLALRFSCNLKGADLPARGMLLRFALPFDAMGWAWHNDMQTSVSISEAKTYENVRALRAYADLPEWTDQPALRMGYSNRNFCTVLTGPIGLCLAVPIDRPCIFRSAYDAAAKRLEIVYDFALSPDTRRPNEVNFAFDLYPCDPNWGFRSALERYYQIYPEMFTNYVSEPGQWMAFGWLRDTDNVNEFYFRLHEGPREIEYDDKLDVLAVSYFTHAGMGANIPDYDPEADPLPAHEVQVEAMEAAFKRSFYKDGMFAATGLHRADGKLDVRKWRVYSHLIAQFNPDPELPVGEVYMQRAKAVAEKYRQNPGVGLDGYYYDGLTSGISYRTDHFKTADSPCLWDPVAKQPFLNNFFSACEFARGIAETLRPAGMVTMMNGALGASFYVAPWLDFFGAETGLRIPREAFNYIRTITYQKPFCTLLKGNYEQGIGRAQMELYMKRCLAYGVMPGFFDWPPSGLGPGGKYWYHPRYYERDRDLFRKYQPLCRALAMAGWEPVTYARSSSPDVFVERYGPAPDDVLWLTLLNEDSKPHATTLTVDTNALALEAAAFKAVDVLTGMPVELNNEGGMLTAHLEMPSDGVMAIQLAEPTAAARWRVHQSLETLDRGVLMRKVDEAKPPILVHWFPREEIYSRQIDGSEVSLVLTGDGEHEQRAEQWAMLFQSKPQEVTLRVRGSGEELAGDEGTIGVRCTLAWVTASYTHYENLFFDLPEGTWDWQDFEFTINSEHPLRAIQIAPLVAKGATGTLRLARLSLSDARRDEYVIDREFTEWYEPVPHHMRDQLNEDCAELRGLLETAQEAVSDLSADATQEHIFNVFDKCTELRGFIAQEGAENGCRRILRDLETIEAHLGMVALGVFDIEPPAITGPHQAVPGETVKLSFPPPRLRDVRTRTELRCDDATVTPTPNGGAVKVPSDTPIGTALDITGLLALGPPGRQVVLKASHTIDVVAPIEIELQSQGMDMQAGSCRVRISLRNNRARPLTARLDFETPTGWQIQAPESLRIAAHSQASAEAEASAVSSRHSAWAQIVLLYIPPEASLLKNPSFEDEANGWSIRAGNWAIETTEARGGKACLRVENAGVTDSDVVQSVTLNQQSPCPCVPRRKQ